MALDQDRIQSEEAFESLRSGLLSEERWKEQAQEIAGDAGRELGEQMNGMDDPTMRLALADALGKSSSFPSSEDVERLRRTLSNLSTMPFIVSETPRATEPKKSRAKRVPPQDQIARRVLKRHRNSVVAFLKKSGLTEELKELGEVEKRIGKGTRLSARHAAFSARNLMEGVADLVFPATTEERRGRDGKTHSLGPKNHKNRLIAYADEKLKGQWEGHEARAFVGTMDAVMRWAGGGPHGSAKPQETEYLYTRMLDALSVLAQAYEAEEA